MNLVGYFIIFSLLGWLIDSGYRSLYAKKWVSGTLVPFLSPLYGLAAVVLMLIFRHIPIGIVGKIAVGTVAMIVIELVAGMASVNLLNRRLWDYSKSKYNINGHIDLVHGFFWFGLVIVFSLIFPLI